jgi:hypothetical protein
LALQFSTELKSAHIVQATSGIFWRQIAKPVVVLGCLVLLLSGQGILWAVEPALGWTWHAALALLMAVTVAGSLGFASRYYQDLALRNFERFKGAPVRVGLEEGAYRYEASWGQGSIEWSQFQSLWCLRDVWVLLQHADKGVSVLLPAADLDEEARNFIRARMAGVRAKVLA